MNLPALDRLRSQLPSSLSDLFELLRRHGGRPYLVGGAVRDALCGLPVKDYDVEVFGLPAEDLRGLLETCGRVHAVGEAFSVFKLSDLSGVEGAVDVALPRRDSKSGPGHRGIAVVGDPLLSVQEAARRRDFTINALLFDPLEGELLDLFDGRGDLERGLLRAVDLETFLEDPLRALRAVQLAARYKLTVEPATADLCCRAPLSELPAERVFGELEKLLLKADRPSRGFALLAEWRMLDAVAPELLPLSATPQEPEWHPEGDVWVHTLQVMDQAAKLRSGLDQPRALALMLGALCHDLGKPATTCFTEGRVRSPGHEEAGIPPTLSLLDRWKVFSLHGYDLRGQVVQLVAHHLKPGALYQEREKIKEGAIRRLSRKCEPDLLERVARADCLGRAPGDFQPLAMDWFVERVRELGVVTSPPEPLLMGRHLLQLGLAPSPAMGRILREVYEKQLDGEVRTLEQAQVAASELISRMPAAGESSGSR